MTALQEWQAHMADLFRNEADKLQGDLNHTKRSIDEWLGSSHGQTAFAITPAPS